MTDGVHTLKLTSLGIDVGTTTSHLIVSRLTLEKIHTTRGIKFSVTDREILYKGNIILTPIDLEKQQIDYLKLVKYLKEEYTSANIDPRSIDTGAVIITGESAKKLNAQEIVTALAHKAGNFVAASAGPNYESFIAAMGSGAVQYTKETKKTIINIDIGGGTSNIAVISNGEILETNCINVGGRLLAFDDDNRIVRIEDPIRVLEEKMGLKFEYGMQLTDNQIKKIAHLLAQSLIEVLQRDIKSDITRRLLMTPEIRYTDQIDEISFSGGVAEYIYDKSCENFNDLGLYLGQEIRLLIEKNNFELHEPEELIRATVIGAGQYTLQVSGVTTHISNPDDTLPIHNIPVIEPKLKGKITSKIITESINKSLQMFDVEEGTDTIALLFRGAIGGSYEGLKVFVTGIANALPKTIEYEKPIILIFDNDIGNSVGNVMRRETNITKNIISIDEIAVEEGDFIDIDKPKAGGQAVPVVVKSLVFSN